MKTYKFAVYLMDVRCDNYIKIKSNNVYDAYDEALDYVSRQLARALPELDIECSVKCLNPDCEDED